MALTDRIDGQASRPAIIDDGRPGAFSVIYTESVTGT